MNIRPETKADIQAIFDLTKVAFAPVEYSDGSEVQIIDDLRKAGDLMLSLVMDDDGVVGHVAFSPVILNCPGRWAGLGPIAVEPNRQRQGIGTALVADGIAQLAAMDFDGCVLVGNPAVYGPMGFSSGGLTYHDLPSELVMGRSITGLVPTGFITYAPAFDV